MGIRKSEIGTRHGTMLVRHKASMETVKFSSDVLELVEVFNGIRKSEIRIGYGRMWVSVKKSVGKSNLSSDINKALAL